MHNRGCTIVAACLHDCGCLFAWSWMLVVDINHWTVSSRWTIFSLTDIITNDYLSVGASAIHHKITGYVINMCPLEPLPSTIKPPFRLPFGKQNFHLSKISPISLSLLSLSAKIVFLLFIFIFGIPNIKVPIECWDSDVVLVQLISTKLEVVLSWGQQGTWNSIYILEQNCQTS